MIETSFSIPNLQGDPFDPDSADVEVNVKRSHGNGWRIPAFFDGGATWRMRMTPDKPGRYTVQSITLNGQPLPPTDLQNREWTVDSAPEPGFVRIRRGRFAFDDGTSYFPLGHNQAWRSNNLPDIPELFGKMHAAGENWSRVWMNAWDGKNLDWPVGRPPLKLGEIDLNAARRWDRIVDAAAKNGIYFQMTLQHHGQYSTTTNPNWNDNPYNTKNGGFLQDPADFFTNEQARALTRRKLRYILARWGYSPNIMAFELFNEVQYTDAAHKGRWNDVAAWHAEMAAFLREHDLNHHLITTSSIPDVPEPVWTTMDYLQRHSYPPDLLVALGDPSVEWNTHPAKPLFVGEFGP
ncbi:MAG: cellulase family glycosylhydrolase, partial [Armatimonadota bacterium]|nr:cellulase family glycosylhydrolase [Armatimonadota bacterium]